MKKKANKTAEVRAINTHTKMEISAGSSKLQIVFDITTFV